MPHQRELLALQAALNNALDALRHEMDAADLPPLSQAATAEHPLDKPDFLVSSGLYEARRLALGSSSLPDFFMMIDLLYWSGCLVFYHDQGELKNLIQPPYDKAAECAFAMYDTANINVAIGNGIFEHLAKAPDIRTGVSVAHLQKTLDVDARKLTTILRHLSIAGWVRETDTDVFTICRSSITLLPGNIGHKMVSLPENIKIADAFPAWIQHPEWKYSQSPAHTAFQLANNTELPLFLWIKQHPDAIKPFAHCVQAFGDLATPGILFDYPWDSLPTPTIVDCGGGRGNLVLSLAKILPYCRFIVQDTEEIANLARVNAKAQAPVDFTSGRINIEVQDFFSPQSHQGDDFSFVLRHVLHDWPDREAVQILSHLAAAAGPKSRILIMERISVPGLISKGPGDLQTLLPTPTSAKHVPHTPPLGMPMNLGSASRVPQLLAVHLMGILNAHDRTMGEWEEVTTKAGLRITGVYPLRAYISIIECSRL
ncbi:S-adenosyl-L-methionine-dependent methyltransferase [Leucogyrophana mollusca]|uniref:S-adenosyl-L-methionine-dependent methyltransferase n=1 Tax=Leucogyrophana mollusca TaxID=85980 RepID=A0ACB8BAE8_9AGAM|nr:S-adenosyl-L-methionine-dependent methyltransferase [Leucogyrophana mollusca]